MMNWEGGLSEGRGRGEVMPFLGTSRDAEEIEQGLKSESSGGDL